MACGGPAEADPPQFLSGESKQQQLRHQFDATGLGGHQTFVFSLLEKAGKFAQVLDLRPNLGRWHDGRIISKQPSHPFAWSLLSMLLFEPALLIVIGGFAAAASLLCIIRRVPADPYRI